jgi:hypothetical protein
MMFIKQKYSVNVAMTLREALGIQALGIAQAGNVRPRFLHCRIAAFSHCQIISTPSAGLHPTGSE